MRSTIGKMKISHKPKRLVPPIPEVNALINEILATPVEELAKLLRSIETWKWPRTDLNAFLKVLNKFDSILEKVIQEYEVDTLQVKGYSPDKKELLLQILRFERLLLEHSMNRKVFNSYDRLNSLMFTSDLDVLIATLLLLLRPSQQYSSQPALSHSLHISTSRLESLAKTVPTLREHGIEMLDLVSKKGEKSVEDLPMEASEVHFQFYRKDDDSANKAKDEHEGGVFEASSNTHSSTHQSLSHVVHLGPLSQSSRSAMDIFADAVKSHQVPDNEKFELLCRIRFAHALGAGREDERQKLVISRLLAIAVYVHTHAESQAQSSLFLYDTDLVSRVGELLQQDRDVPILVQMAALSALDAFARYRGKISEVFSAVNVGVNHGILMSLLRKTVLDISNPNSTIPNLFVDALISFVTYISSHQNGGNMLVGAGLVPLLIQIIGVENVERLSVIPKTLQLLDNLLYGYSVAFTLFCNSRGVEALVTRIKNEVDLAVSTHKDHKDAHSTLNPFGLIPISRSSLLKQLLKSLHRMMQSSGTSEGMRGLIDTSVLKSVQTIIEYRGIFGPPVLPIAINIVATFVHNEPTSLTAIQEAKLPETIFKAFEAGIEPSFEVIQSIPNVLGALCLNQAGQDQLAAHPSIIPALFSILTSETHLKVLLEKENAANIGSSIDELVRHHPTLKNIVFNSVISTLKKIEMLGKEFVPASDIQQYYLLGLNTQTSSPPKADDVPMEEVHATSSSAEAQQPPVPEADADELSATEESQAKTHDNLVINYIDVVGRFLEGLFQHAGHCKDFIQNTEGLDCISRLLALPCLPYDYANQINSDALVQVIRMIVEVCPADALIHLVKQVQESLDETSDFWKTPRKESTLLPYIDINNTEDLVKANDFFHRLITLHIRVTLLADVYSTAGYIQGRQAVGPLQKSTVGILPSLGALHRSCMWENIVLKNASANKGLSTSSSTVSSSDDVANPAFSADAVLEASANTITEGTSSSSQQTENKTESAATKKEEDPRQRNAQALRHIASQIPNALGPFFQSVAKLLVYNRRAPDEHQKQQAEAISATLADVLLKHLTEFKDENSTISYAYHTVMISLVTVLMFDERATHSSYNAALLVQFRKVGGLDAVFSICRRQMDAISRISALKPSERSESDQQELVHAYGGLRMVLNLLILLISYNPNNDMGQIAQYICRNKPETHPDFFQQNDFLVKMRLAVAPVIKELWESEWLVNAPPAVSKIIIKCVQTLISGDNEVPRPELSSTEMLPSSGQDLLRPSVLPPDEDQIRQITDMGFPRESAVRALAMAQNNVNYATDFLLNNPYIEEGITEEGIIRIPSIGATSGEAGPSQTVEGQPASATEAVAEGSVMETEGNSTEQTPVQETHRTEDTFIPEKTMEERRQELDAIRQSLASNVGPLALRLADVQPVLIFDVRQVFIGPSEKYQPDAVRCVINDIQKFSPAAYDLQEEPLAVRCRLLALILADSTKVVKQVSDKDGQALMDMLHALLLSQPIGIDQDQPLPKWLPALLLAMESLLVTSEEPRVVPLVTENEEVTNPPLITGPRYAEARSTLFELCIRLLHIPNLPRDELLASLRMLVQLTRDYNMATQFVHRDGISLLLKRLNGPQGEAPITGFQSHIAIILRHLVEDPKVLASAMSQEIKRLFNQFSRAKKSTEVLTFVRNSMAVAARDYQTFLNVTKELCVLVRPDVPNHQLCLKESHTDKSESETDPTKADGGSRMQVDEAAHAGTPAYSETLESVVHFMINELMSVGKRAHEALAFDSSTKGIKSPSKGPNTKISSGSTGESSAGTGSGESTDSDKKKEENQKAQEAHVYACFLMQCLSELLFSYDQCKIAFLAYPKKRNQTPAKDIFARSKSVALSFLLKELITFGAFNVEPKFDARKRIILCNWAMSVLVALCLDSTAGSDSSTQTHDITSIRKLVLESISKAIKETPPHETLDAKYGRTLALVDLCYRLLTLRFGVSSAKSSEEAPMHLAKIMLEKNFVSTLTTVLNDIDLNYPNMRSLVVTILRPLEYLTKVAIKMGRSDKGKEAVDVVESSSSSGSSDNDDESSYSDEEMDVEEREETPDLYRNSSLGMISGDIDDGYNEEDEEVYEEDEEDEDEEMDVGYDENTGSSSSTDSETEDEADEEAIAAEIDRPSDVWADVDEEMRDEEDIDDGEEDDDLEEEGHDDPQIMMWEDGQGHIVNVNDEDGEDEDEIEDGAGDGEDEERADDDEADMDMMSAGDDVGEELELEPVDFEDPFNLTRTMNRGMRVNSRFLFGPEVINQTRDPDDMQIFGRAALSNALNQDTTSHPLLVDEGNIGNGSGIQARGAYWRRTRGGGTTNAYNNVLQTIEDLVGGGALQLVQQLMSRSGFTGSIGADIRVEVPSGAGALLERGHIHRHGRPGITTSVRLRDPRSGEARGDGRDFGPLQTLQRWSEEAKITHGKHLQDRTQKLCNHIVLALLPAAREEEKKRKEQEQKEREAREKAAKEAAEKEAAEKAAKEAEEKAAAEKEKAERETAEREATEGATIVEASGPEQATGGDEDTEMVDITNDAPGGDAHQGDPSNVEASSSAQTSERVTVMIHGNQVDITDTGIDPTFLEALPDDMREEVLNQHFREQRSARAEPAIESQISPEFLDALPPEIRAEILREERLERDRRERQERGQESTAGPTEMETADFIASLDPQLRQVVLLDSDDGILQSLPSHIIAEAGALRENTHRFPRIHPIPMQTNSVTTQAPRKTPQVRDAIQLLDKNGIAALVRLLFFPQLSKKSVLNKVLLNLCENSKSRTELFNLLLSILQDGTGDLAVVDKSFSQLSVKNTRGSPLTSRSAGKQKELSLSTTSSLVPSELPPDLVAQRCLDALSYIVETNELSSLFFLTEHELPVGLKKSAQKKGKGKDRQGPQSHYPIVLLLGLLDRHALLKTPSIMDAVAQLLDAVTRPLTSLKDELRKKETKSDQTDSPQRPADEQQSSNSQVPAPTDSSTTSVPSEAAPPSTATTTSERANDKNPSVEAIEEKILFSNPPQIPHPALRSIVNILTVGECSGRTFQHTLALIQHLSFLPDARDVIAQELRLRAHEFGQSLSSDLDTLIAALKGSQSQDDLPPDIVAKFSPASSDQAKLLRVLKTIDYMYSKAVTSLIGSEEQSAENSVKEIYETFRFTSLWKKLSECLTVVESKSNVEHIATILLPLIESLMVVCKNVGVKGVSANLVPSSPRSPQPSEQPVDDLFVEFTDEHRKILNLMVRNNPSLMSGSFSLLVQNPRVLDFDNKRNYFNQQLRKRPYPREPYSSLHVPVRRARVFEDSFQVFQNKTGEQIKYGKLSVRFHHEEGVDAGGVTREWFQILARQMFNPDYALFEPCAADRQTYQPNRASEVNPEHLSYFKFVGRVIGKAIYDGRLMDAHFARSLYRQLLGKRVDYKDVEWVDPEYYKSLCWILENDPTVLDLTFITEVDEFGRHDVIPLKENGTSIPVTMENRKEYVQLSAQYRLHTSIAKQIDSLLSGFYEIVPKDLISIFNEQEVELLISGTPDIDVDEWRAATEYNGLSSSDPVIVWWWRALKSFTRDERAKVLSFATGTSRVPLGGFTELQGVQGVQRFSIHRAYGEPDRLPQAHTCFNQIDLPEYSSYEKLRQQLLLAINEGGEGFGFA